MFSRISCLRTAIFLSGGGTRDHRGHLKGHLTQDRGTFCDPLMPSSLEGFYVIARYTNTLKSWKFKQMGCFQNKTLKMEKMFWMKNKNKNSYLINIIQIPETLKGPILLVEKSWVDGGEERRDKVLKLDIDGAASFHLFPTIRPMGHPYLFFSDSIIGRLKMTTIGCTFQIMEFILIDYPEGVLAKITILVYLWLQSFANIEGISSFYLKRK